ncbi:hypothetical protein Fcan01_16942 [Folsomia candida]|uniref:Uncharacterized protein n=1 Tax=Folsomia candida TaxID=158441 RepID=A0A226DSB9_FOLCA|nr:hypothetical protein Fcan01_16942 [Folsomia candida]
MYSNHFLLANHVFKKVSSLLGANPILFDIRTSKFYSTPYSRLATQFNMVLLIIQFIFGIFRLLTFGNLSKKTDHELFAFNATYMIILAMLIPLICLVILTFNCQDQVDCLNQALQYALRTVSVAGYWFFGCVGTYLIGILPLHYISVIPIQLRSRNVVCAHLAVFGHEIIIGTVSVGIALQILSSYVAFLIPFHSEFELSRKSGKYTTHSLLRSPTVLPLEYRCLELLHRRVVPLFPGICTISNSGHSVFTFLQLDVTLSLGRAWVQSLHFVGGGIYSRLILGISATN